MKSKPFGILRIFNLGPWRGGFGCGRYLVNSVIIKLLNAAKALKLWISGFGKSEQVPVDFSQAVAPEDELLKNSNLYAYSLSQASEPWEMCTFNPNFPELGRLKSIVKQQVTGQFYSNLSTRKIYGYLPLNSKFIHLQVFRCNRVGLFGMEFWNLSRPCLINLYLREYLFRTHLVILCPLIIVNKNGEIRMAVEHATEATENQSL